MNGSLTSTGLFTQRSIDLDHLRSVLTGAFSIARTVTLHNHAFGMLVEVITGSPLSSTHGSHAYQSAVTGFESLNPSCVIHVGYADIHMVDKA